MAKCTCSQILQNSTAHICMDPLFYVDDFQTQFNSCQCNVLAQKAFVVLLMWVADWTMLNMPECFFLLLNLLLKVTDLTKLHFLHQLLYANWWHPNGSPFIWRHMLLQHLCHVLHLWQFFTSAFSTNISYLPSYFSIFQLFQCVQMG